VLGSAGFMRVAWTGTKCKRLDLGVLCRWPVNKTWYVGRGKQAFPHRATVQRATVCELTPLAGTTTQRESTGLN